MGLTDKLYQFKEKGKKLALVGLVGSLGYLSGCGPALTGMGVIRGGTEGAAVAAFGQGITQIEAAKAGKDEVNQEVRVYDSVDSKNNSNNEKSFYFLCNEIRDVDGNGRRNYPYDFKGIKKIDSIIEIASNEPFIHFVAYNVYIPRKRTTSEFIGNQLVLSLGGGNTEMSLIVLNEKDEIVYKDEGKAPRGAKIIVTSENISGKLQPGNYKAYWIIPEYEGYNPEEFRFKILED